jgi:hypothetical protein
MNTNEQNMAVSRTILEQLGGHKFVVMTGARNIFSIESGLSFKIPGTHTKNHINFISITLDPSDTYTIKFFKFRGSKIKTISEHSMIYDDMLQKIFTAETGLDTHF